VCGEREGAHFLKKINSTQVLCGKQFEMELATNKVQKFAYLNCLQGTSNCYLFKVRRRKMYRHIAKSE
jgi:hypothetical protein